GGVNGLRGDGNGETERKRNGQPTRSTLMCCERVSVEQEVIACGAGRRSLLRTAASVSTWRVGNGSCRSWPRLPSGHCAPASCNGYSAVRCRTRCSRRRCVG